MSTRQTGSQLVALVDDDASLRTAIRRQLRSPAFRVVAFASADELLSSGRLDENGCLVVDVRMPGKSPRCPTQSRSRARGRRFARRRAC